MNKARYNEVPKEYRRNYTREVKELLQKILLCAGFTLIFAIIFYFYCLGY